MSKAKKTSNKSSPPLGDCAESHGSIIIDHTMGLIDFEESQEAINGSMRLCHGLVSCADIPPHFHAWIEFDKSLKYRGSDERIVVRFTYDRSNGNSSNPVIFPADVYRILGKATDVVEYTPRDACSLMAKLKHYGPWDASLASFPNPP